MKTTDSVMREKRWKKKLEKIISSHSNTSDLSGEAYPLYGIYDDVEDLFSHSLAEDRREERERFIKLWNEHCKEYTETDKYWADRFAKKLGDLLTGDNPEEAK